MADLAVAAVLMARDGDGQQTTRPSDRLPELGGRGLPAAIDNKSNEIGAVCVHRRCQNVAPVPHDCDERQPEIADYYF